MKQSKRPGRIRTEPRARPRAEIIRDAKRQVVIDAARRVFETHGLEGASIRLIAKEAGCTTGAVYPYFKGKEDIYAAILSDSLASLHDFLSRYTARRKTNVERARAAVDGFYAYYRARPTEMSLGLYLFREPGVRPLGLSPDLDRSLNAELRAVFEVIVAAISTAGFDDAQARAADGVCHAVGLLMMGRTGRLKTFGERADPLMEAYLKRLLPGEP